MQYHARRIRVNAGVGSRAGSTRNGCMRGFDNGWMRGIAMLALLFFAGGDAAPHSAVHKLHDGRKFRMALFYDLPGFAEWSKSKDQYEGFLVDYIQGVAEELGIHGSTRSPACAHASGTLMSAAACLLIQVWSSLWIESRSLQLMATKHCGLISSTGRSMPA